MEISAHEKMVQSESRKKMTKHSILRETLLTFHCRATGKGKVERTIKVYYKMCTLKD